VDSTIVPWAWTSDELRAFAEEAEELDTWNYRSDWRFRLHGDTTWYRGSFDYELLQRWT
jgi:hypothetical protein